jgi:hypothetical protein
MKQYTNKIGELTLVSILLLGSCANSSELPTRSVLHQSPEMIEGYFGSPISSKTSEGGNFKVITEVTYQPSELETLFPNVEKKEFTVTFADGYSERIDLNLGRLPSGGFGILPDDESEARKLTSTLFRYVFGGNPDWKLLSQTHPGESLQAKTYCLNPGIATDLIEGQLELLNIYIESQC